MASNIIKTSLKSINSQILRTLAHHHRTFSVAAANSSSDESDAFTFSSESAIHLKAPKKETSPSSSSVTMPMSFMTGSIVGKRFYNMVTTRESDDGNGWSVMLDYRTLKTPSKRPLKLPTLPLAKAIAAEWDYQQTDGIRPFTMPLMKIACTALERVPIVRPKIIDNLMSKFNQDLVFCRAPKDNDLTSGVYVSVEVIMLTDKQCIWSLDLKLFDKEIAKQSCDFVFFSKQQSHHPIKTERQVEKIDPLLKWVESEFGYKPVVYSSFFGGKQDDGLIKAIESVLKKADDCELAAIDALTAASHSLTISIAIFRGRLQIEEAIELIRLEEDLQVDKWGLVEGGHDVDVADLRVQIASAAVFLGLTRRI